MWQAPNQRVRALQIAKKRQQDRLRRPIHIKRARAELKVVSGSKPEVREVRILLNDVSAKGLGFFSHAPLQVGQEVAITLEEPTRVFLKGKVIWCQEHDAASHVISKTPYSYRLGIAFIFQSKEEEETVRQFYDKLAREHLFVASAA